MEKWGLSAAIAAASCISPAAYAATIVAFTPGAASPTSGMSVLYNFDTTTPASLVLGPLVQIKSPPADPNGAPPANSTPAGTKYLSVLGGGLATILFPNAVSAFSFDWGSIDSYNTLTILPISGLDSIVVPGSTFTNTPANGNQVAAGTNGLLTVTGTLGTQFRGFILSTTSNSFEIDDVAVATSVPEPSTWAMMLIGFAAVGMVRRRRSRIGVRFA